MADGLSIAASAVGLISLGIQVTQTLVDFYVTCKARKSDVDNTTRKLRQLLSVLGDLEGHLVSRRVPIEDGATLKNIENLIEDCEECFQELHEEVAKFKTVPADGVRDMARNLRRQLTYPFRQSTLQKLNEDVDEALSSLSLAFQVLLQKGVTAIQDDIGEMRAVVDLVRADQVSSAIRSWLKAPDASTNYNEACKKKHASTGQWLVQGEAFRSWLQRPNSFLWLSGFAGSGKSVLCSTAIQHAVHHQKHNFAVGIAFFFFTFSDESKQDASAMLRTLVLQLSGQLRSGNSILGRLREYWGDGMPSDEALIDCLRELVQSFGDVFIFIDALDESPRHRCRNDVLQALIDLGSFDEPSLHLLVTSRGEPDIRGELEEMRRKHGKLQDETVDMRNPAVNRDMAEFISHNLRNSRRLRKWEPYHEKIEAKFAERAGGVFRWIECQFQALERCPRSEDLLDRLLESLPESLDETYDRMLSNIQSASVDYATRILTLLCCSKTPLTVSELIEATAVDLGDSPRLNPKRKLKDVDDIHEVCAGLISVSTEAIAKTGDGGDDKERQYIRIAHFSVQEYLESERIKDGKFHIDRRKGCTQITQICLTYLLEPPASTPMQAKEHPLAHYAASMWYAHLLEGDASEPDTQRQISRLFTDEKAFKNWLFVWNIDLPPIKTPLINASTPLYYASLLGLDWLIPSLLTWSLAHAPHKDGKPTTISNIVNGAGGTFGTALQAASARSHVETVRLLLDNGADVEQQRGYYKSALQAAAVRGSSEIVELLLARGANPNIQGGYYRTALQAACIHGREDIVRMLLGRNADVNIQGGFYKTALQVAATNGSEGIVRLLLDHGADPNICGGHVGSALRIATARGYKGIVKMLEGGMKMSMAERDAFFFGEHEWARED